MLNTLRRNWMTLGVILLVCSLPYSYSLWSSERRARGEDDSLSYVSVSPCQHPLSDVTLSRRVISDAESVALKIVLSNTVPTIYLDEAGEAREGEPIECEAEVELSAPAFEVEPKESVRKITVPPGANSASLVWILTPKKQGIQTIALQGGLDSRSLGLSVTNVLGLTPQQAQLVSYIGAFLGGPVTLARIYQGWAKYQTDRQKRKEEEELRKQDVQSRTTKSGSSAQSFLQSFMARFRRSN